MGRVPDIVGDVFIVYVPAPLMVDVNVRMKVGVVAGTFMVTVAVPFVDLPRMIKLEFVAVMVSPLDDPLYMNWQ